MKLLPLGILLFLLVGCATRADLGRLEPVRTWKAAEANQGVAVDAEFFYAIDDRALGKYEKATGRKVGEWRAPAGSPVKHLNSGVVVGGQLLVAHSNFPAKPDESTLEYFDVETLRPAGRKIFEQPPGSLTWLVPAGDGWLASFAHYRLNSDPGLSRLVRYDSRWNILATWTFPPELLARFGAFSCSGGGYALDGRIWVSGHDARELYVLELPPSGGQASWVGTVGFVSRGQAFAWDPSRPQELYSIQRKTREVIVSRLGGGQP
jgi:outer membrane protein assembly factor BamB